MYLRQSMISWHEGGDAYQHRIGSIARYFADARKINSINNISIKFYQQHIYFTGGITNEENLCLQSV